MKPWFVMARRTGPLQRDPWGAFRFVRVGGATPFTADVFSAMRQGMVYPTYADHEPVWPMPALDGDAGAQGMFHADAIDRELAQPRAAGWC